MKLLFKFLILLLLFSASVRADIPFTAGALTNPAINTILADSGPVLLGTMAPSFVVCSTVAAVVVLEYRDITNTVNLYSQVFTVPLNDCRDYTYPLSWINQDNERVRLRLNSAIVGSIQASLNR